MNKLQEILARNRAKPKHVIVVAGLMFSMVMVFYVFADDMEADLQIALLAFIIFGFVAIYSAIISEGLSGENGGIDTREWWANFMQGVSTEMVGAIITGILFVFVVGAVEDRQVEEQWKRQLILQMGSPDNGFALEAARILSYEGWAGDGSLKGANLEGANLAGVDLQGADLQGANLWGANLQEASLPGVNLQETFLAGINLQDANLGGANLQGANLASGANLKRSNFRRANLQDVELVGANLQGADLAEANLQGADLTEANLQGVYLGEFIQYPVDDLETILTNTILPDGSQWAQGRDMGEFTDPEHPNFWRSDNRCSPAYAGDEECEPGFFATAPN